jgi:hypothetical protein
VNDCYYLDVELFRIQVVVEKKKDEDYFEIFEWFKLLLGVLLGSN